MTDRSHETDPLLSIVIIAYNEADRIETCIESVLAASSDLVDHEILLVDGYSTDETVEKSSEYPITILRIPDADLRTPGAGRYVGTKASHGETILFVDGDMEIRRKWLERALDTLSRDRVAAVDGHLNAPADDRNVRTVDAVRGVALYDRAALEAVGGFDPYLQSLEDIHLGFQLTSRGYRLLRRPECAADHPRREMAEPLRRWRRGYMIGPGQALRRSMHSPRLLVKHISRLRYRLALLAWLFAGVASVASSVLAPLWLVSSAIFGVDLARRLGLVGAFEFVVSKSIGIPGVAMGLLARPRHVDEFPLESVEVVQEGTIQHAGFARDGW